MYLNDLVSVTITW